VVISEVPYGTTTESLIASIEAAVQKGRVKVASIDDYTTDRVEIELALPRGVTASEVIPQLYAYTDCSVSVSSNVVVIVDRRPVQMTVSEALRELTEQLVLTGMAAFEELFVRPLVDEDVKRLLELRIRRISAYDIERNRRDIDEVVRRIAEVEEKLADLTRTTTLYLEGLIEKYGDRFPRRTEIASFEGIDKKAVARQTIKLAYDAKTGLFGSAVRGSKFKMTVSEYDLILGISNDGSYRVMTPPEKLFFSGRLIHCAPFDPDRGFEFTLVYRDAGRVAYGKRVRIDRFIRNREYRLIKDEKGKVDLLLPDGEEGIVSLQFVPVPRQRVRSARFDLSKLEPTGVAARGVRLASKPVARLKLLARKRRPAPPPSPVGGGQTSLF
jgi:topoisomerase-4 subunit A